MSGPSRDPGDGAERRCECGNLLARLTARGVEVKCRRCKRVVELSWEKLGATSEPLARPRR
jgi:hypothetical protein